jgi:hypothetical protein
MLFFGSYWNKNVGDILSRENCYEKSEVITAVTVKITVFGMWHRAAL